LIVNAQLINNFNYYLFIYLFFFLNRLQLGGQHGVIPRRRKQKGNDRKRNACLLTRGIHLF